jgi:hypothetical protein
MLQSKEMGRRGASGMEIGWVVDRRGEKPVACIKKDQKNGREVAVLTQAPFF